MIKSFKGTNLVILDEQVNEFIKDNYGAKVIHFRSHQTVSQPIYKYEYIYIVSYEENMNEDTITLNKNEYLKLKDLAWKYETLCD